MDTVRPGLNDEIRDLIMDGLSSEAEIRPVYPGDVVGVWQNHNDTIVNYYHVDPNSELPVTTSGLAILAVGSNGQQELLRDWRVTRWSSEESLVGRSIVEIKHNNFSDPYGHTETRTSRDPSRTYKALARLAKIHLDA